MNYKTTYILFGILALVLAAFIVTLALSPSSTESSDYVLPSMHKEAGPMKEDDITRVEIERTRPKEEKLVFVRDPGTKGWHILEPRNYQADSAAIDRLVHQIAEASLDPKSDVDNTPKPYGLDTPAEVISLVKESEPRREVKLKVGDASPGSEKAVLYVSSSDRSEVMAVKKSELDSVKKTLADFRSRELLSPSTGDIERFSLMQTDRGKESKTPIELKKTADDRWVYAKPAYGDAQDKGANPPGDDKAPENVESVLNDLVNLKIADEQGFIEDDAKDLGKYHLDPATNDILRIEVERVESIDKSENGDKSKKTKKIALLVGVGTKIGYKKDRYYAYLENAEHKDIATVPASGVARLLKLADQPGALRDRNLVSLGGFRKPDAIDIQNGYGLLEFRRSKPASASPFGGAVPQETWQLWRSDSVVAVDEAAMQAALAALTSPNQVKEFKDPSQRTALGLDKPDAVVRIWADSLPSEDKKDEKKDDKKEKKPQPKVKDKPDYTLSFGRLEGKLVAVERKRGDEQTGVIVLIDSMVRDRVAEGPLAYLDKQLPPFSGDRFDPVKNITKLTLTRDGTIYEMSRENKPDAPWKIDKPAEFAGRTADRTAVEDILRELNNLRAVRIVADKPEAAKLADWGLKSPRLKAVVAQTQDGKTKTFEFEFGNEMTDKSGIYLHTLVPDWIVVAGNTVAAALQRELLDLTVFHFDVSKVQEVKLTGWIALQKQVGVNAPLTKVFKRAKDSSAWESEPKDSFKVDPARLDEFLKNLADLKALKFVAHKATPKPDWELDTTNGGLQIELTVAGDKEPSKFTLTIGKLDGDAYLAVSNRLNGDIFTVRKDLFEKAKEKPIYFSGQ